MLPGEVDNGSNRITGCRTLINKRKCILKGTVTTWVLLIAPGGIMVCDFHMKSVQC